MAKSNLLQNARAAKNNEFYTKREDIEKEMAHHKNQFRNKTVFCNCDDPFESNFFKFFVMNFQRLGLKKLICMSYAGSQVPKRKYKGMCGPYKAEINHVPPNSGENGDLSPEQLEDIFGMEGNSLSQLKGDGDFRSEESIACLQEADITTTNPPFSFFREYMALLIKQQKHFIIVGNMNAVTYKEVFPLLKENKIWLGCNPIKEFRQPDGTIRKFGNIVWFTNMDIHKRHEELPMTNVQAGHESEYPHYDNYDAINVNKISDIPADFPGIMGVPITFLEKYNPNQFEIIGLTQLGCHDESLEIKKYDGYWEMRQDGSKTGSSGKKTNGNPNLAMNDGKHNYFVNSAGHIVQSCYKRIFIRNRLLQDREYSGIK